MSYDCCYELGTYQILYMLAITLEKIQNVFFTYTVEHITITSNVYFVMLSIITKKTT